MGKYKILLATAFAATAIQATGLSDAQAADVTFGGSVAASCVLTVGVPGVLGTSTDNKTLSSKTAGGTRGTVVAVATGTGFNVTSQAPTAFASAPSTGGTNTELSPGVNTVGVDLTATKTVGVFEAGAYVATTTVTCE